MSESDGADICVRADWPRRAGTIERSGDDYFWMDSRTPERRQLLSGNRPLPIPGSATMTLSQPSPLSNSATLVVRPPHRFDEHVDGIVLVDRTFLIGAQRDCHVRCDQVSDRGVIARRGDRWVGKLASSNGAAMTGDFVNLPCGERVTLESLAITLEQA